MLESAARGLAAGFCGTVALTASQRIEMAVTGRQASELPAKVLAGLYGIEPESERGRAAAGFAAHWINNTFSGLGRAALGAAGLRGAPALAGGFALYLGGEAVLFRSLGFESALRPVDALHAAVWATVTNAAYERLDRAG